MPADPVAAALLICFLVGAALIGLMFVSGLWAAPMHMHHGSVHGSGVEPTGSGASHALAHQDGASPFNTLSLLTFITWFGGTGYLLRTHTSLFVWIVVALAIVAGVAGGGAIFLLLAKVLLPHQTFLDPRDYDMVGTVARITVPIRAEGTGEVVYVKGGSRRADAARSERGVAIERGTEVVIVRYARGVAYVEPWSDFVARSERAG